MGLFKKTNTGLDSVKVRNSTDFWRRIPVMAISADNIILDDFSVCACYEIERQGIEGIEKKIIEMEAGRLASFFKNLTSSTVFVQFTSLLSDNIKKTEDAYLSRLPKGDSLIRMAAEETVALFKQSKTIEPFLYCTLTVPLSIGVTVDGKRKKTIEEDDFAARDSSLKEAEHILFDTLVPSGYKLKKLSGKAYLKLLSSLINADPQAPCMDFSMGALLPLRKKLFASDFRTEEYFISNGTYKFCSLVMDILPTPISAATGATIMEELNFPCLYNVTILNEDQEKISKQLESQRKMAVIFSGKKLAAAVGNKSKVDTIDVFQKTRIAEGWKVNRVFASFLLWDTNGERLKEKVATIRVAVSKALDGAGVFAEWLRSENAFVASLPGCAAKSFDMVFLPSPDAVGLVPLRGMYKGDRESPVILMKNRWSGLTAIDPFSSKQNKWAGIVIGPTGSGKSYFINSFICGAMLKNPIVVVIDMATVSSYEPVVNVFGGAFMSVTMTDAYRVNMFDLRVGMKKAEGSKIMSLDAMLSAMLLNEGEIAISKETQAILQRAIQRVYQRGFEEEPRKVKSIKISEELKDAVLRPAEADNMKFEYFLEYRDYYVKKFQETADRAYYFKAEMAQGLGTPTLNDFLQTLSTDEALTLGHRDREICEGMRRILNLYAAGPQSVLFNGVTNLVIEKDIFCFHVGMLKERKETLALALLLYRDFAMRKAVFHAAEIPAFVGENAKWILEMQKRPKLFIYDEFHNLKGNHVILDVLDKDARQQRALGLATYLITQDTMDVAQGNFLSASANKFFLRHISPDSPSMQAIDNTVNACGLGVEERDLLMSLKFFPGKYSELFVMNEDIGKGVMVNYPVPVTKWMFTTHKDERYLRDVLTKMTVDKGKSLKEAQAISVRALSAMYPEGTIGIDVDVDVTFKKMVEAEYI